MRGFSLEEQKRLAEDLVRLLSLYGHIADASVIEFFTDRLWSRLPLAWQAALDDLPSPQLAALLLEKKSPEAGGVRYAMVWPLSLLSFKASAHALAFPRRGSGGQTEFSRVGWSEEFQKNRCQSACLHPMFRKHVKPKKQHEILRLGQVVKRMSEITGGCHVIDVGSGQGHLSRYLAFGLHLSVTGIEGDAHLVAQAAKFDQELVQALEKQQARRGRAPGNLSLQGPGHVVGWVDPQTSWPEFLHLLRKEKEAPQGVDGALPACWAFTRSREDQQLLGPSEGGRSAGEGKAGRQRKASSDFLEEEAGLMACGDGGSPLSSEQPSSKHPCLETRPLLLTGLHACGDLSVALLRHFVCCPDVVGLTSVACCYMKLTTQEAFPGPAPSEPSYPLSHWVSGLPGHQLSYKAREGACHALEDFTQRLQRDSPALKTHCFRAMLEAVIQAVDPTKRCLGIQTIKKAHELSFEQYVCLGLQRVGLSHSIPLEPSTLESMLAQQQRVVAFFSLALLLGPVVETLLLVDRMIFLQEQDVDGIWTMSYLGQELTKKPAGPSAPLPTPAMAGSATTAARHGKPEASSVSCSPSLTPSYPPETWCCWPPSCPGVQLSPAQQMTPEQRGCPGCLEGQDLEETHSPPCLPLPPPL